MSLSSFPSSDRSEALFSPSLRRNQPSSQAAVHLYPDHRLQTCPGRPPSVANGLVGAASAQPRGAALFRCLGAASPSREQKCRGYVTQASWIPGIKRLCFTAWQTAWKVQRRLCSLSPSRTSYCSELTAFALLDGGKSRALVQLGCVTGVTPSLLRLRLIHSKEGDLNGTSISPRRDGQV